MRSYQILAAGAAPQLISTDLPEPGDGQIRVAIRACGLNFADLLMQRGTYQDTPEAPFTLGMEIAGIVDKLGTNVPHL